MSALDFNVPWYMRLRRWWVRAIQCSPVFGRSHDFKPCGYDSLKCTKCHLMIDDTWETWT